jgi:hypothetical protein
MMPSLHVEGARTRPSTITADTPVAARSAGFLDGANARWRVGTVRCQAEPGIVGDVESHAGAGRAGNMAGKITSADDRRE